ncbi:MAG: hypothetical protein CME62_14135 [Halobacteriovoraceae bacterium]|nr:hypothetical protein [Halobacteriovoraceae bacterium]|tara:strand:- start:339 stop:908 length:570 start_codon:yes stop_codon:yes gene_type:complete
MKKLLLLTTLTISMIAQAAQTKNYSDGSITVENHRDGLTAVVEVQLMGERAEDLMASLKESLQDTLTFNEYRAMETEGTFSMEYGGGHYSNLESMDGELICTAGVQTTCAFIKDDGRYNARRFPFFPAAKKATIKSDNIVTSTKAILNVSDHKSTRQLHNVLDEAGLCSKIVQRCYGTCTSYCQLMLKK